MRYYSISLSVVTRKHDMASLRQLLDGNQDNLFFFKCVCVILHCYIGEVYVLLVFSLPNYVFSVVTVKYYIHTYRMVDYLGYILSYYFSLGRKEGNHVSGCYFVYRQRFIPSLPSRDAEFMD